MLPVLMPRITRTGNVEHAPRTVASRYWVDGVYAVSAAFPVAFAFEDF